MKDINIRIVSAGAGSGKTYRLVEELSALLNPSNETTVRPQAVIAATFTNKAAAELIQRVRTGLLEKGWEKLANDIGLGLFGTVNSVCGRILQNFSFESGLSPDIRVIPENEQSSIFYEAISTIPNNIIQQLGAISRRFEFSIRGKDWREEIKSIVDVARANNLSDDDLELSAEKSTAELINLLPQESEKTSNEFTVALAESINSVLPQIKANDDSTKDTTNFVRYIEKISSEIQQTGGINWADWVRLSNAKTGSKSRSLAEQISITASSYLSHPSFHQDLRSFIKTLFKAAQMAMKFHKKYKEERGLMDFVDQEALVLNLLDNPDVAEEISENLDLLIVDEFQDTSPIQLSIFLKLAKLANQSIWVGDPKQSIYAFRGADPSLMDAVVKTLGGIKEGDILTTCYRSRKDIVHFVNNIFVPALSDKFPESQVSLSAIRNEEKGYDNAVQHWYFEAKNLGEFAANTAIGIKNLLDNKTQVATEKGTRDVRPNDIAVLCRTNRECMTLAKEFQELGMPVSFYQAGLFNTPEGSLVLALLRRLFDENDTLATAEIISLLSKDPDSEPENWLQDRLQYLKNENPSHQWQKEHPIIKKLDNLKPLIEKLTPLEAVVNVIETIDLRRILAGLPNSGQRLSNLEAIITLAGEYEESGTGSRVATLSGFVLYLYDRQKKETDHQGIGLGNAVNILTYHGSKGLGWPVVVNLSHRAEIKNQLWGLSVVDDREQILLEKPLEKRWLRYWPWPFGKLKKVPDLDACIESSPIRLESMEQAAGEDLRLLYVGLTRAKDYLIIPTSNKHKSAWMQRILDKGDQTLRFSNKGGIQIFKTENSSIPIKTTIIETKPLPKQTELNRKWFQERKGRMEYQPAFISASTLPTDFTKDLSIGETIIYGDILNVERKTKLDVLGNAIHAFFAEIGPNEEKQLIRLLRAYNLEGKIDSKKLLENISNFYSKINASFQPLQILTEYPIQLQMGEQLLTGTIDMILEIDGGWIVIDHKTFSGDRSEWGKQAEKYSSQLTTYSSAIEIASGKPVKKQYINFVIGGGLVEICRE
jgi:ATP-dependent helicase/nuclease subunit A